MTTRRGDPMVINRVDEIASLSGISGVYCILAVSDDTIDWRHLL